MAVISQLLLILGSLGVFLLGMKIMNGGIQLGAGERLRSIMATMCHNRFTGLLTGLLVTCLVQSSSATTVMVVSFVNSGLMTLAESIGVIMGANLGTTITAWIIATIGKFSLAKIALYIIGAGIPFFFAGRGKLKALGEFLVGFGLLFLRPRTPQRGRPRCKRPPQFHRSGHRRADGKRSRMAQRSRRTRHLLRPYLPLYRRRPHRRRPVLLGRHGHLHHPRTQWLDRLA